MDNVLDVRGDSQTVELDAGSDILDIEELRRAARVVARMEVADALSEALAEYGKTLSELERISGLDPGFVSRLRSGTNKQGGTVASLAQIALALGKTLKITIE